MKKLNSTLHNFLMPRSTNNFYATSEDFDRENEGVVTEGQWRNEENFLNGTSLLPLVTIINDNSFNFNQCKVP
uniref:Nuclease harbi1 n=1 Tax=Triatoma infestans TaxID=30076 RepID=A0A161M5A9_TRIIF